MNQVRTFRLIFIGFFITHSLCIDAQQLFPFKDNNGLYGYRDTLGNVLIPPQFNFAKDFSEGFAAVGMGEYIGTKYGFIDVNGKEIVPLKYDGARDFSEGLAVVNLGGHRNEGGEIDEGKFGAIDKNGNEIIPIKFDAVMACKDGMVKVNNGGSWNGYGSIYGGLWGMLNKSGKEIVAVKYNEISAVADGLLKVQLNDKYGYIDKSGKEVIPIQYEEFTDFVDGLAKVKRNGKFGYINPTGKEIVPCKYDKTGNFSKEGMATIYLREKSTTQDAPPKGKWGFIDKSGKEIIPCKYDYARDFSDGLALVSIGCDCNEKYVPYGGKWGFIDQTGKEVIDIKYNWPSYECHSKDVYTFVDGVAKVILNNKYGYIDKNGKEIIPTKYNQIQKFSKDGFALVNVGGEYKYCDNFSGGKWGYIDKKGNEIIPPVYNDISVINRNLIKVGNEDTIRYFNYNHVEVIPPGKYEGVSEFKNGFAKVSLNNKFGFINATGKEIIRPQYEDAHDFSQQLAAVMENGKWGYIDTTGITIFPFEFDAADNFSHGGAWVGKDGEKYLSKYGILYDGNDYSLRNKQVINRKGKYGLIDSTGKEILSPEYDEIREEGNHTIKVVLNGREAVLDSANQLIKTICTYIKNNKYGFITFEGKILSKPKYEFAEITEGELFIVALKGKYGLVDKTQNEIVPCQYDYIEPFHGGKSLVMSKDREFYIDTTGKEIK